MQSLDLSILVADNGFIVRATPNRVKVFAARVDLLFWLDQELAAPQAWWDATGIEGDAEEEAAEARGAIPIRRAG
jgi:hypothetical protein